MLSLRPRTRGVRDFGAVRRSDRFSGAGFRVDPRACRGPCRRLLTRARLRRVMTLVMMMAVVLVVMMMAMVTSHVLRTARPMCTTTRTIAKI
jgi:predicted nucleic acid-binding Zn ribbon protein